MNKPSLEPTVFLVDDDDAVRQSLQMLISTYGLRVSSLPSAEAFLAAWKDDVVGCLILDVHMRDISGLALQDRLQEHGITLPVIFVTDHSDINSCRHAFKKGAVDFLVKPIEEDVLMKSIGRAIVMDLQRHRIQTDACSMRKELERLSEREREVLTLMLEGLPNKLIARQINLSTRTVESHRARIFAKLKAASLAQLVRRMAKLEVDEARLQ